MLVDAHAEQQEKEYRKFAWMIRWLLLGEGIKNPPSIDAILGKKEDHEVSVEKMVVLLNDINRSGNWDA